MEEDREEKSAHEPLPVADVHHGEASSRIRRLIPENPFLRRMSRTSTRRV
jgi:hypothetical protein